MLRKFEITNSEGGAALVVHLHLGSEANKIMSKDKDVIHINLTTVDEDEVEDELTTFLAETLQIKRGRVAAAGKNNRKKIVIVMDLTPDDIERRLFS